MSSKNPRVSLATTGKYCLIFAAAIIEFFLYVLCCSVCVRACACTECPPLGMESHKVESDQLSASSMSQYNFAPQRARLNMQVHTSTLTVVEKSFRSSLKFYTIPVIVIKYLPEDCFVRISKVSIITALNQMKHFSKVLTYCYFVVILHPL